MSTYYINNSGSAQYPYDTPSKGATNFQLLDTNILFQNGDVIRFVTDGGIIDDSNIYIEGINKSLTFESYDPIYNKRATWELGTTPNINFFDDGCNNLTFDNINFHFSESTNTNTFIQFYSSGSNLTLKNCKIDCDIDLSNTNSLYLIFFNFNYTYNSFSSVNINNNEINNMLKVINSDMMLNNFTAYDNKVIVNFSAQLGSFYHQSTTGTTQSNLSVYSNFFYGIYYCVLLSSYYNLETINIYSNNIKNCNLLLQSTCNVNTLNIYSNKIENCVSTSGVIKLSSFTDSVQENILIYDNTIKSCNTGIYFNNDSGLGEINNLSIYDNEIEITNGTSSYNTLYLGLSNSNNINVLRNILKNTINDLLNFIAIYLNGGTSTNISNNITIKNNIIEVFRLSDSFLIITMTFNSANNWDISYNNFIGKYNNLPENSITISNTSSTLIKNFKFNNNIIYTNSCPFTIKNFDASNSIIDYNCYSSLVHLINSSTLTGALTTSGTHNVNEDPLFTNFDESDYYLRQDSPCIDTGILGAGADDDIGAIDYIDGVNVYIQDSVIINLTNETSEDVVLRIENNAFDYSIISDFNVITNKNNQFNFSPPSNYPLTQNNIGYDENLTWILNNKSVFEPFDNIDEPPNLGKDYPDFTDYPYGLFGYRRSDGQ